MQTNKIALFYIFRIAYFFKAVNIVVLLAIKYNFKYFRFPQAIF